MIKIKTPEEILTRGKGNFLHCTDYDDAVKAMKQYAIDYQEQHAKKSICDYLQRFTNHVHNSENSSVFDDLIDFKTHNNL